MLILFGKIKKLILKRGIMYSIFSLMEKTLPWMAGNRSFIGGYGC